jgi:hypothetical protein
VLAVVRANTLHPAMNAYARNRALLGWMACLVIALCGCGRNVQTFDKELLDETNGYFRQYLDGDIDQARKSIVNAIHAYEDVTWNINRKQQAFALWLGYARLYALERKAGRQEQAQLALVKARYWALRQLELEGPLTPQKIDQFLQFNPDAMIGFVDKMDKSRGGRAPHYMSAVSPDLQSPKP